MPRATTYRDITLAIRRQVRAYYAGDITAEELASLVCDLSNVPPPTSPWGPLALGQRVRNIFTDDVGRVRAQRRDGLMVWVAFDDVETYGTRPMAVEVSDLSADINWTQSSKEGNDT